ncbi:MULTISPECIES: Atu4866 domain-containing protein [unclassified Sinorhizobium]|uniref:Atu4866 domain-containing protein n=1 Tax=unclassified Sinorhizobium TaxID=2613772 RepID=UPI0035249613
MKQPTSHRAPGLAIACVAFLGFAEGGALGQDRNNEIIEVPQMIESEQRMAEHPYVGMWVTEDGHIQHELFPNGRYDEARGNRKSAYQGRYEIRGNHIEYWDDTGFTADGDFVDRDTLHHGGMIFRRR